MCGRVGALSVSFTRWRGRSSTKARTSTTTIASSHQYSRRRSISSPVPLCVVTSAQLAQISDQQTQKEAENRDRTAFDDERRPRMLLGPACAAYPRDPAHDAHQLARLEIVRLARKDQAASQRPMVQMGGDL